MQNLGVHDLSQECPVACLHSSQFHHGECTGAEMLVEVLTNLYVCGTIVNGRPAVQG